MQMLRKGKEKAPEPKPKKKKSRTEKQQEREEQATRAMLAQEARRGRGHGGALRITERETRQSSRLAWRGEETHQVIPEGVQMEEYTMEQIQRMDTFHKNTKLLCLHLTHAHRMQAVVGARKLEE